MSSNSARTAARSSRAARRSRPSPRSPPWPRAPLAEPASADTRPDYAPIPASALGPAVTAQGYFVGRVEKNLYWVTDGTYQVGFPTTREGVVLFAAWLNAPGVSAPGPGCRQRCRR
jgi:hypothetical protein